MADGGGKWRGTLGLPNCKRRAGRLCEEGEVDSVKIGWSWEDGGRRAGRAPLTRSFDLAFPRAFSADQFHAALINAYSSGV